MKHLIVALFAGSLALSSAAVLAADTSTSGQTSADQPSKVEKAENYVKEKAHNAKEKTKRVAKKTKNKTKKVVAERKATDPSQVNESKPDQPPPPVR